ncbi:MAG: 16S rRNA (cytosine(967)-C(5))-methyltransferase RsmB [Peptococcaceae bacterium]|mgnify:CR=1 FL=1|nr:16S rRNA (cytosine(967)-C(5))-methyltransferase RsmB [Peptococcaceae bacterium]
MAKITAREIALQVLKEVEGKGAYAGLALDKMMEKYRPGKLDRAFATELAYGTLRYLKTIDWILEQYVKKPLEAQTASVRNILRLSVYQLFYLDKVPDSAACNEGAKMARKYGHVGVVKFVNGVLRNILRRKGEITFPPLAEDPVGHIAIKYSHPTWMVERWLKEFGLHETMDLCQANNVPPPNTIRTNTLKNTRDELITRLKQEGLTATETRYTPEGIIINGFLSIGAMDSFREGRFQVQDESSMLASRALAPSPGSTIIDFCSAPGGKATHLAQLMNNQGKIWAIDIHPHKLALVGENSNRLGISIIEGIVADAAQLPEKYTGSADYVLVDAPCSGLGVLRRRPDARWRKEPGQIAGLAKLQAAILERAAHCVKDNGILVYSTCTITREENQDQVESFLAGHPEFVLEDLAPLLPQVLDKDGTMADGYLQLLPHRHAVDGFFIARMRKEGIGKGNGE